MGGSARGQEAYPHEAVDVDQDILVAAFRALGEWGEEGRFFSRLYRITLHFGSKKFRGCARLVPDAGLDEGARRLGISLGPAKSHLHRALCVLRDDSKLKGLL